MRRLSAHALAAAAVAAAAATAAAAAQCAWYLPKFALTRRAICNKKLEHRLKIERLHPRRVSHRCAPQDEEQQQQQQQQQQASHIAMALTRRQKFVLLCVIGAVAINQGVPRERAPNVHRDRAGAMRDISLLTDRQFKQRFRMSRNTFSGLLANIRHALEVNEVMATRSSGEPVYPYLQQCIALRYLAGGSYLDIADVYKVCCACHRNLNI